MSALAALATHCEQATGSDRELDLAIAQALQPNRLWQSGEWSDVEIAHQRGSGGEAFPAPSYTSSADAALTLIPDGWKVWGVREDDSGWWVGLSLDGGRNVQGGWAPTPTFALAMSAAALRAHAAIAQRLPN